MEKEEKRADQENDTEEQSTEAKSLLKKKLQYYSSEIQRDVGNLVKWLMIAVLVGCITGAASTLFSFVLKSLTPEMAQKYERLFHQPEDFIRLGHRMMVVRVPDSSCFYDK